jgi:hypothetical protein
MKVSGMDQNVPQNDTTQARASSSLGVVARAVEMKKEYVVLV